MPSFAGWQEAAAQAEAAVVLEEAAALAEAALAEAV